MGILDAPPKVALGIPAGVTALTPTAAYAANKKAATALQKWHGSLMAAPYTGASAFILGDSVTAEFKATAYDRGYVQRTAAALRTSLGLPAGGRGYINGQSTSTNGFTWPVALTGTPANNQTFGPNRFTTVMSSTQVTRLDFSLVGTSADILYYGTGGNGTFSWSVDGGSATNQLTTTGGDGKKLRVSLGAAGAHTLTITLVSGTVYLEGVIEYNGDEPGGPGLQLHALGFSGWTSSSWTSIAMGTTSWVSSLATFNSPSLMGIFLGLNDVFNAVGAAQFATNLTNLIAAVRAIPQQNTLSPLAGLPCVLILPYSRAGLDATWPAYQQAAYGVAAADPLTVIADMSLRLPSGSTSPLPSVFNNDSVPHPNDSGHALIAQTLARFLLP